MPSPTNAPSVFISYSHKDEAWKDRLLEHLGVLEKEDLLQVWEDRRIGAGEEWFEEIRQAMNRADVAVLMISPPFLNSNFIRKEEIPHLLERRKEEGMHVFPVIVRSCVWDVVKPLASLQARPRDGRPLADFRGNQRDRELVEIAREILSILKEKAVAPQAAAPLSRPVVEGKSLSSLHQLPSPPADFTGRKAELEELRAAVKEGGVSISGVRGMGGMGKTTLALQLAAELMPLYPDAQFYLDLKGIREAGQKPLSPTEAMAHVIRSCHPEACLPENHAELEGLYRSVLHSQRVLLLMDNAADAEQVMPLIPPFGCLLLVTSRFRFTLPGLFSKDLDELPHEDAVNLLRRIAPRVGNEDEEIASLCGGLPFALRLAGSALAERPDLAPAAYARQLKDAKQRLGLVAASLSLSFGLLDAEKQRLWSQLAVFPDSFDAAGAAAVWELAVDSARDTLGELLRSSLIEWEDRLYRLHDLARVFAGSRLKDRLEAEERHAKYYANLANAADDLHFSGGAGVLSGLKKFDQERANILAGQNWAACNLKTNRTAAMLCQVYGFLYCLPLRLHPHARIEWLKAALEGARISGKQEAECTALGNLGNAYCDIGEIQNAIECYEAALDIARSIGSRQREGSVLGGLGSALFNLKEFRRAAEHYEQWLAATREIGDKRGESRALGSLGNAYSAMGEESDAIEYYEQALLTTREIGDRQGEASALGSLGIEYGNLGELRRAIEYHEQQIAIAREIGDLRGESRGCWNLGLLSLKQKNFEKAIELMQITVHYEREIGHPDAEPDAAYLETIRTIRTKLATQKAARRSGKKRTRT